MRTLRGALVAVALASALLLAYGLLPPAHPSVNTASLVRPAFAALCLLGALAAWSRAAMLGLAASASRDPPASPTG